MNFFFIKGDLWYDDIWRHSYEPPLVGFRGAVNLAAVWANEMMRLH